MKKALVLITVIIILLMAMPGMAQAQGTGREDDERHQFRGPCIIATSPDRTLLWPGDGCTFTQGPDRTVQIRLYNTDPRYPGRVSIIQLPNGIREGNCETHLTIPVGTPETPVNVICEPEGSEYIMISATGSTAPVLHYMYIVISPYGK